MGDVTDADLIGQLKDRESNALGVLYDRYGQVVYSLFLRTCRDASTAEDLVQELFLRVWNRAQYFDPQRGSLGVWILSIARNMAIDHSRSARVRFSARLRPMEEAEFKSDPNSAAGRPESGIDEVRTVRAAFSYLNQKQKQVLELAYFEGLSQSEIARKLSEPLGTVKSWMRSGLSRMRETIKAGGAK
ncbi:MAG TPA: sigma-70 family RNA polymerase sigma factor [Bryobacteraceae bacterium]|nr:sigma-70 family RNA polymerase sigma factor [Bryobacteraceae bacterium]